MNPRAHKDIFEPYVIQDEPAEVLSVRRCLIGRSGVCFGLRGPLKESYHADYVELESELTKVTIKHALRYGISFARGSGGNILFHNSWSSGYYHWLIEAIPRLLRVRNFWGRCRLIIPEHIPNAWFSPWLEEVSRGNFSYLERGAILADHVVMAKNPKSIMHFSRADIQGVREYFHDLFDVSGAPEESRLIYISRSRASHRRIANELPLSDSLRGIGFQVVYAEELSFREQVELFSDAKVVVSVHGAGLSNSVFMRPGGTVIEIAQRPNINTTYGTRRKTHLLNSCFRAVSECCDLRHRVVLGEFNRETTSSHVIDKYGTLHGDIRVNIEDVMDAASEAIVDHG